MVPCGCSYFGSLSPQCAGGWMQKADKGPLVHSRLCDMYLFTSVLARSRYSVSLFIVFRGGFASVRPHSRADHSLGQEPVYLYTDQQCALVNVRKVYEIYADGHNLVNVWKMGNRRCPAARSRVIHCGPKAPQGAHPLILLSSGPGHGNIQILL